eukprot:10645473-Alexandrium_andersonii.AAC.1
MHCQASFANGGASNDCQNMLANLGAINQFPNGRADLRLPDGLDGSRQVRLLPKSTSTPIIP